MEKAKFSYELSNGVRVNVGDNVIITMDKDDYIGDIYDIGEDFISINLYDDEGNHNGELDAFFSDIQDVQHP